MYTAYFFKRGIDLYDTPPKNKPNLIQPKMYLFIDPFPAFKKLGGYALILYTTPIIKHQL